MLQLFCASPGYTLGFFLLGHPHISDCLTAPPPKTYLRSALKFPSCARAAIRPNSWGQGQQPGMCSSHQEEMGRPGDRNTERRASADPVEGMRTPGGSQAQGSDPAKETGFLKAKSLPRRFPGRNTRMLMTKDPSQYSPRFRYLFLGG